MDMSFYESRFRIYPASVNALEGGVCFMADAGDRDLLCITGAECRRLGRRVNEEGEEYSLCELSHAAAEFLREKFPFTAPAAVLEEKTTFGVGDRLGLAGDGLLRVFGEYDAYPVLAQQSVREMDLTHRTMADVVDSATFAVFRCGYRRGFGADGDHLKKEEDVREAVRCGYTMITLDLSDYLDGAAAVGEEAEPAKTVQLPPEIAERYLHRDFALAPGMHLAFREEELLRIYAVYQRALDFVRRVWESCLCRQDRRIDLEISIDETQTETSPQAHFYVASELRRSGVRFATIAPRFVGEFQKGIDYIGDPDLFREDVRRHLAVADHFGYKLSFHSGSDKFRVFPVIAEVTGGRFHLKTSGTNWLEALRTAARTDPALLRDIYRIARATFEKNRVHYHVTPELSTLPDAEKLPDGRLEELLELAASRQVLHIGYGEVLADPAVKERLYRTLRRERGAYSDALYRHIGRHARALGIARRPGSDPDQNGKQEEKTMRAVYMKEPGSVSLIEKEMPAVGEGDVLIRVRRVGLCGTDLQSYRGVAALTNYPLIPGHEVGGEVVRWGSAVPAGQFFAGQRVTVKPYFNCGHCYPCSIRRINCCENSRTLGVQLQNGALCDYIAVPYGSVLDCGDLSFEEIALIEPLSVGAHLVSRAGIRAGEYVLVFGCGVIGSGVISAAGFRGAKVIVADIADEKKENALAMGAFAFINPKTQDLNEELRRITGGAGVSAALECIGLAGTMAQAIEAVNFAGRVGYVGYSKKPLEANATLIVKKELDIVGSRNALIDEFITVKKNISEGRLDFKRLVSAVYPPERAAEAFAEWDRHPGDFVKIQISFE